MSFEIIPELKYTDTTWTTKESTRSAYLERKVDSDTLLITVGDSWTWGDSLGGIDVLTLSDDLNYRKTHVYGHYIQQHLQSDWINYGICGACNSYIFHELSTKVLPYVTTKYSKIIVVGVLTETARSCSIENISFSTVDELLEKYEHIEFSLVKNILEKYDNVQFVIARNFTYSYHSNIVIFGKYHLKKTWVDVISDYIKTPYTPDLRILTNMVFSPLTQNLIKHKKYKSTHKELFDLLGKSLEAILWLERSPLNYKKATKHPTELAHEIWANYIIAELTRLHI